MCRADYCFMMPLNFIQDYGFLVWASVERQVFVCKCDCELMDTLLKLLNREFIHQLGEKFGNFYLVAMIPRVHLRKEIR